MSESCENCGAHECSTEKPKGYFKCKIIECVLLKADRVHLARLCKHYPVPKPPEPSEFEKWWEKHRLFLCPQDTALAGWQACREKFLEKCLEKRLFPDTVSSRGGKLFVREWDIKDIAAELEAKEQK